MKTQTTQKPVLVTRSLASMGAPTYTPWGPPQQAYIHGPGIFSYSTAGHGGMWLDPVRFAQFRALFPKAQLWAGDPWFEEDCDASLVVLAFPEFFGDSALRYAVQALDHRSDSASAEFHASHNFNTIAARFHAYNASIANLWERGSLCGDKRGWTVFLSRVSNREERKHVLFADYPSQEFYTDAEVAALALPELIEA